MHTHVSVTLNCVLTSKVYTYKPVKGLRKGLNVKVVEL